jgi:uncharacterized protein (DUF433 family)
LASGPISDTDVQQLGDALMKTEHTIAAERISQDSGVMAGKPVIRGTRIPVERVIAQLAHNPDVGELFAAYPELTLDDVKAALEYAHSALAEGRARTRRTATAAATSSA